MQHTRTCPCCGAEVVDGSTPAPNLGEGPRTEERAVVFGPPLVEHPSRDYLGRPVGVVGVDDVGIPMV